MLFGVGVSCRILYSIVSYLYVRCSGSIISVREEGAYLSATISLLLCGFCSERFPLPLCALFYCDTPWGLPYNYFTVMWYTNLNRLWEGLFF